MQHFSKIYFTLQRGRCFEQLADLKLFREVLLDSWFGGEISKLCILRFFFSYSKNVGIQRDSKRWTQFGKSIFQN